MSADFKKKSTDTVSVNNSDTVIYKNSEQKMIDMTNHFYLEMSKNILTEEEYDIMQKIILKHYSFQSVSTEYSISKERIRQIYKKIFFKIKSVSGLVGEVNVLKERKTELYKQYVSEYKILKKEKKEIDCFSANKKIIDSHFPFSKRLWNMLTSLEVYTFKDLLEISLETYPKFRGFKGKCLKEFIQFIEFENIEEYFEDDFYKFKEKYTTQ